MHATFNQDYSLVNSCELSYIFHIAKLAQSYCVTYDAFTFRFYMDCVIHNLFCFCNGKEESRLFLCVGWQMLVLWFGLGSSFDFL